MRRYLTPSLEEQGTLPKPKKIITKLKSTKKERLMEGTAIWTAYYRRYPYLLAEKWNIHLKPFQIYILCEMFRNNYSALFCSRGIGKTWLVALFCLLKCVLYPGTKIVVASFIKSQAMKVVTEKIPEIINGCDLIKREIDHITNNMTTDEPNVRFYCGSWIKIVPASDNARSGRANCLILDEFRMIDQSVYLSVLRRFLATPRQCGYMKKEEYKNYPLERNKEIFLTSAYFKFNWAYTKFRVFLKSMVEGKKYFVYATPYQMAIKEKLSDATQLKDEMAESDFNPIIWEMEMNTIFYGQAENAFFNLEELDRLRTLNPPIYPKQDYNVLNDKKFRPDSKVDGEIRFLACDIATRAGIKNDASSFILFRLIPDKNGYIRQIPYLYAIEGADTVTQALKIKRLYDDLDCDYIVLDTQNVGVAIYDQLIVPLYDMERGVTYESWIAMNNEELQKRCQYSNAKEVVYSISASESFNDEIARSLKDMITRKRIQLLGGRESMLNFFDRFPDYYKLSTQEKAEFENVYTETDSLINEMILLESVYLDNVRESLKLKTVGRNRKDKYTALAYGNYFAKYLEQMFFRPRGDDDILTAVKLMNSNGSNSRSYSNLRSKIFR